MKVLSGYKTYIAAGVLFIIGGLRAIELLNEESYLTIRTIVEAFGLAALRAAITKIE